MRRLKPIDEYCRVRLRLGYGRDRSIYRSLSICEGRLSVRNPLLWFSRGILSPGDSWSGGWVWVSLREGPPHDWAILRGTRVSGSQLSLSSFQDMPMFTKHYFKSLPLLRSPAKGLLLKGFSIWHFAGHGRTVALNSF